MLWALLPWMTSERIFHMSTTTLRYEGKCDSHTGSFIRIGIRNFFGVFI